MSQYATGQRTTCGSLTTTKRKLNYYKPGKCMPIRPENKKRYPKNWKQIADNIRRRAQHQCEGSPDFPDCRAVNGKPHPITGSKVVLTVAHLDHQPENCNPDNLKAWCQKCHLNYDKHHHKKTAYATRMAKANTVDLFKNINQTGEQND